MEFEAGTGAVITGGASGIGYATAEELLRRGLNVMIADADAARLAEAEAALTAAHGLAEGRLIAREVDVSDIAAVEAMRDAAMATIGRIAFVMNNAGIQPDTTAWGDRATWERIIGVNLWGVINGVQAFTPALVETGAPAMIVNTGSKQGITNPPGNPAYSVSKSGVKTLTEQLSHELRQIEGCAVTAHLLVPGFTFTPLTASGRTDKPEGAWTPAQVAGRLFEGLDRGDFYILCPDNEVTEEIDAKRIRWAANDIVQNRPAMSRWHPDHAEAFRRYMDEA